jgi:hypothetical protein
MQQRKYRIEIDDIDHDEDFTKRLQTKRDDGPSEAKRKAPKKTEKARSSSSRSSSVSSVEEPKKKVMSQIRKIN